MDKTIDHRLAWLAGIIDGEGTIGFAFRETERRGRTYSSVDWWVMIANTDPIMVDEVMAIADVLGIRYSQFLAAPANDKQKPVYRVSFNSKHAVKVLLRTVVPFLVNKQGHALIMLRALLHRYGDADITSRNYPFVRGRAGGRFAPPANTDPVLCELAAEMTAKNRRGPKEEDSPSPV